MRRTKQKHIWTRKRLIALGIPAVLIPGLFMAIVLGWNPTKLDRIEKYYEIKTIFPTSGVVTHVTDGDTFELERGVGIRMIGIDAPNRGEEMWKEAKEMLQRIIDTKRVFLEYDRYQDDKYGRVLAWIWVGCEQEPTFLPADYMHLSYNSSRDGLHESPKGCTKGTLVNREMVKRGFALSQRYKERGELKYERWLQEP